MGDTCETLAERGLWNLGECCGICHSQSSFHVLEASPFQVTFHGWPLLSLPCAPIRPLLAKYLRAFTSSLITANLYLLGLNPLAD